MKCLRSYFPTVLVSKQVLIKISVHFFYEHFVIFCVVHRIQQPIPHFTNFQKNKSFSRGVWLTNTDPDFGIRSSPTLILEITEVNT